MKAVITPLENFTVIIDGEDKGLFTVKSSWEGFTKLTNNQGDYIIVVDDSSLLDKLFRNLFGNEQQSEYDVIRLSNSLLKRK